jgi:predicted nuclease of predicted toxin-antitoxin system
MATDTDEIVVAFAVESGRVVVSSDMDFGAGGVRVTPDHAI